MSDRALLIIALVCCLAVLYALGVPLWALIVLAVVCAIAA